MRVKPPHIYELGADDTVAAAASRFKGATSIHIAGRSESEHAFYIELPDALADYLTDSLTRLRNQRDRKGGAS